MADWREHSYDETFYCVQCGLSQEEALAKWPSSTSMTCRHDLSHLSVRDRRLRTWAELALQPREVDEGTYWVAIRRLREQDRRTPEPADSTVKGG